MNGYFYPNKNIDSRAAVQAALDEAAKIGRGIVVLEGEWEVDGTLYISDNTTLLLKGADLTAKNKNLPLITNSNRTRPRGKTLFGTQARIAVIGEGVISGMIELVNVADFIISGVTMKDTPCAINLSYVTAGRVQGLRFEGVECCILAGIGTRNCYFTDISAIGEGESIRFCSDRIPGKVVNYFGPDVKNNTVRGIDAKSPVSIYGDYCYDIVINA
jgi:hypothetical protein